jgi:hypothetical protein
VVGVETHVIELRVQLQGCASQVANVTLRFNRCQRHLQELGAIARFLRARRTRTQGIAPV